MSATIDIGSDASEAVGALTPFDPDAEWFVMHRLGQADELVRAGLATAGDGAIQIAVGEAPGNVTVDIPLPPKPLEPVIALSFPAKSVSTEAFTRLVGRLNRHLEPLLRGQLHWEVATESAQLTWTPEPPSLAVEALSRARAVAEHLALLASHLGDDVPLEVLGDLLLTHLSAHQRHGELLAASFERHAFSRAREVGVIHLLTPVDAVDGASDVRLLGVQLGADLLSPQIGRGFYLALRPPGMGAGARLFRLGNLLADIIRRRLDIALVPTEDFEVMGQLLPVRGTLLFTVEGDGELAYEAWIWRIRDLFRFTTSLLALLDQGHNPFELLGAVDPGEDAEAEVDESVETEPIRDDEPPPAVEEAVVKAEPPRPPRPARPARPKQPAGVDRQKPPAPPKRPAPPKPPIGAVEKPSAKPVERQVERPEWPPAALKAAAEKVEAQKPAKGPSFDKLSAREVVKRLGMQEVEDVDVFMSHAGYNPEKTVDIMAIALSMSKEEAQDIVERAPCLIVGPVTRTRAAKMKTILEGTGATVQVIETGQTPD